MSAIASSPYLLFRLIRITKQVLDSAAIRLLSMAFMASGLSRGVICEGLNRLTGDDLDEFQTLRRRVSNVSGFQNKDLAQYGCRKPADKARSGSSARGALV